MIITIHSIETPNSLHELAAMYALGNVSLTQVAEYVEHHHYIERDQIMKEVLEEAEEFYIEYCHSCAIAFQD